VSNLSPKVVASTLAAAAVTIICWAASLVGIIVPAEVAGALTVIATFLAGYLKIDDRRV
jgi:hypothetical protein